MKILLLTLSLLVMVTACGKKDEGGGTENAGSWTLRRDKSSGLLVQTAPTTITGFLVLQNGTVRVGSKEYQVQPLPNQVVMNAINLANSQGIYAKNGMYKASVTAQAVSTNMMYPQQGYTQYPQQQQQNNATNVINVTAVRIVQY